MLTVWFLDLAYMVNNRINADTLFIALKLPEVPVRVHQVWHQTWQA